MSKLTDQTKLLSLFKALKIKHFKVFKEQKFICGDAVASGAVISICIHDADFNFDLKGKFVGTNSDAINSFIPFKRSRK